MAYVKKTFFFTKYLDLLTPEIIFELKIFFGYIPNF